MPVATQWPVNVPAGQRFGANKAPHQPDGHTGIDFPCPIGTNIMSVADGKVLYAGSANNLGWPNSFYIATDFDGPANGDQSAGNILIIDHGDFVSIYAHLSTYSVRLGLNTGQFVSRGQVVAKSGNTGFSTGPHLHFEILPNRWNVHGPFYGRVNPELYISKQPALASNQRVCGPLGCQSRKTPNSKGTPGRLVPGGQTEVFDGWVNGEVLSGIGIWYHDNLNLYYWAGAFESQSTAGLKDLNAPATGGQVALKPNQRMAGPSGVTMRSLPDKNSTAIKVYKPGDVFSMSGYVEATDPYGTGEKRWWVSVLNPPTYFHFSGFADTSVAGFKKLPYTVPAPSTPTVPTPAPAPYDFALDFAVINGITVEKVPAALSNVERTKFPAAPSHAVMHWWNAPTARPAFDSVLSEFRKVNVYKSSHFVVTDTRIAQMVSLKDRAYHAGATGNEWVGVEIDPLAIEKNQDGSYTARALKIQENVRALNAALRSKYGYKMTLILHKNVPGNATACSDLVLATLEPLPPVVVPPVVVTPPPAALTPAQLVELKTLARQMNGILNP